MSYDGVDLGDVNGTIQKYFNKKWMDMPQEAFSTPLANSNLLETATIPKNMGQSFEFRKFNYFSVETNGTDDSPMTYSETDEPSDYLSLTAGVFQVPFTMLRDKIKIGNIADVTDPTGLIKQAYKQFRILLPRKLHQLTNDRCVKSITDNLREDGSSLATTLPDPFKTIYAGSVENFENLEADSYVTMDDFRRAVSLLRNANVPGIFNNGELFAAIVSQSVMDQLTISDSAFAEIVMRHRDLVLDVRQIGMIVDYAGCRFIRQSDPYRCKLDSQGGALTTRSNTGPVVVSHVLGRGAMGYVDLGDPKHRRRLAPRFKVQDITETGTGTTIGYSMAYQAAVLDQGRGVNVAGCSSFSESIDDIA